MVSKVVLLTILPFRHICLKIKSEQSWFKYMRYNSLVETLNGQKITVATD